MSDWIKVLLSAGLGFFVAIASEPIKAWWLHLWKSRRINKAIYSELGRAYHLLNRADDIGCEDRQDLSTEEMKYRARAEAYLLATTSEAYRHYLEKEREFVLELDSYPAFKSIYYILEKLIDAPAWQQKYPLIEGVFKEFENHFRDGSLDDKMLLDLRAQHRERTFQRIIKARSSEPSNTLIRDNRP